MSETWQTQSELVGFSPGVYSPPALGGTAVPQGAEATWLGDALNQLAAIGRLAGGWDSNRGEPARADALAGAYGLVASLARVENLPRPHVNPTPSGGVQLEWESGGRYFEIEIVGQRAAQWFYRDQAVGMEEEGQLSADEPLENLVAYIRRMG